MLTVIREMKINTMVLLYFIPIRMAGIKKAITHVGKDVEKLQLSYIAGEL